MAWNGSGTYTRTNGTNTGSTLWADDKAAAVKITTDRHDTHDEDIATAINATLTQNNESKPTAHFLPNVDDSYNLGSKVASWLSGFLNGGLLFKERADHVQTPGAAYGEVWVKSDTPCTLQFTDDAGTDFNLSPPTVVSGHIRAGNMQILSAVVGADDQNLTSLVTENTLETFGPTGSGATNIWDALDVLPSTARFVICNGYLSLTTSGTGSGTLELFATDGDSSPTPSTAPVKVISFDPNSASASLLDNDMVFIPLNSSQVFKATWRETSTSARTVALSYKGFVTD